MRGNVCLFLVLAVFGFLTGCAGHPQSYVHENLGLGYVKKIAILPFENNTQTKFAEERLRDVVATEILSRNLFSLVEKGDTQRFLREEIVSNQPQMLNLKDAQKLGKDLQAQAYLAGSVDDYSEVRNGPYSYYVVAATFRLVDTKTGEILWQVTDSESGYNTWDRVFGLASDDANQLSFILVKRMLGTLR